MVDADADPKPMALIPDSMRVEHYALALETSCFTIKLCD